MCIGISQIPREMGNTNGRTKSNANENKFHRAANNNTVFFSKNNFWQNPLPLPQILTVHVVCEWLLIPILWSKNPVTQHYVSRCASSWKLIHFTVVLNTMPLSIYSSTVRWYMKNNAICIEYLISFNSIGLWDCWKWSGAGGQYTFLS